MGPESLILRSHLSLYMRPAADTLLDGSRLQGVGVRSRSQTFWGGAISHFAKCFGHSRRTLLA